ncbi:MAG: hypothetical protein GW938_12875 [Leptospira sp.]|jgi:hypothetical protein|nr:hypothetical protein [Leptospira sp.]NCS92421.1 hypothetical protein [Leptospira sp.]
MRRIEEESCIDEKGNDDPKFGMKLREGIDLEKLLLSAWNSISVRFCISEVFMFITSSSEFTLKLSSSKFRIYQ